VGNRYALYSFNAAGVSLDVVGSTPESTTPAMGSVWLKNVARPFLNRVITVVGFSDITRPARGGVVEPMGRRLPVAITEVRGSRRYELLLRAATAAEVDALALVFSFGDTVHVHVPLDCPVPGGHFFLADVTERRPPKHDSVARYFSLPLTEVDVPDASIIGYTATIAGIVAAFATCADVLAAFATCLALLEFVSAPDDETVG